MIIYFNQSYTSRPYVNYDKEQLLGNIICGPDGLLNFMMQYGAVAMDHKVSAQERQVVYYTNMKKRISKNDIFYNSFSIDPMSASNNILAWRDLLVAVGWNLQYDGDSERLKFICAMEPHNFPHSSADDWAEILRLSHSRMLLPPQSKIVVTQHKEMLEPKFVALFDAQQKLGVKVEYKPIVESYADGNLSKLQKYILSVQGQFIDGAILQNNTEKIEVSCDDSSIEVMRFESEDEALRYVATLQPQSGTLYLCQQPKRFDNTLRLLGCPTSGSKMECGMSQVLRLFTVGNGLFEYPLNINRVLAWLNASICPIRSKLRRALADVITSSGGVFNQQWNEIVGSYFNDIEDEQERNSQRADFDIFMPVPTRECIDVEALVTFNKKLSKWAIRLANSKFQLETVIRDQLLQLSEYCNLLIALALEEKVNNIKFLQLQRWCQNIVSTESCQLYPAEIGAADVVTECGDIHSIADSLVWFCACDKEDNKYPYEFLNVEEYDNLKDSGVYLYDRNFHGQKSHYTMARALLNSRKVTIIEAKAMSDGALKRHPQILQLEQLFQDGFKNILRKGQISEEYLFKQELVDNGIADDQAEIRLEDGVELHQRWENGSDESYSSIDKLIQHPFDYVCRYNAKISDIEYPSSKDLNKTLGNVAHRIIEKVFTAKSKEEQGRLINEDYDRIFNESVDEVGLLLRSAEFTFDYNLIYDKMRPALRKLQELMIVEGLEVQDCEYNFNGIPWTEAGENVTLGSRVDMLFTDRNGDKVIFDFKWRQNKKKYVKFVEENTALQLSIYRYLAQQTFGKDVKVRVAYVVLPSVEIISADHFESAVAIATQNDFDNVVRASNSYRLRWQQLQEGRIECVEGKEDAESEYVLKQQEKSSLYYPLERYKAMFAENIYEDYKKLK